jgi:hypothetical protein
VQQDFCGDTPLHESACYSIGHEPHNFNFLCVYPPPPLLSDYKSVSAISGVRAFVLDALVTPPSGTQPCYHICSCYAGLDLCAYEPSTEFCCSICLNVTGLRIQRRNISHGGSGPRKPAIAHSLCALLVSCSFRHSPLILAPHAFRYRWLNALLTLPLLFPLLFSPSSPYFVK